MLSLLHTRTARGAVRNVCPTLTRSFANPTPPRTYRVLAIETSCDDTSVAIVDFDRLTNPTITSGSKIKGSLRVLQHSTVTANNDAYSGIHPLVALESHRSSLAPLIQRLLSECKPIAPSGGEKSSGDVKDQRFGIQGRPPIDLVAVTRGPGMRSNLAVGLDTAKGLAVAWNVPIIGVHHMQAHALTSRLVSAMENGSQMDLPRITPEFPFLSVLVSGGHTMLIDSTELNKHEILAETQDIAMGDCLDKAARAILPPEFLRPPFGRAMETFAFDRNSAGEFEFDYTAPISRQEELRTLTTRWEWSIPPPLRESKQGQKSTRRMVYSFTGLLTLVERLCASRQNDTTLFSIEERRDLAREVQRVAFEHLASRILLYLTSPNHEWNGDTVVISGGVASNMFLRHVVRKMLDTRGFSHVQLSFPPVSLCTDNALMIAWAGIEMYEAGYTSKLDIGPIRKWSMDPKSTDGGILGVEGWQAPQTSAD